MIIGIGGRLQSGKTVLSSVLEDMGFIKLSFASYLKQAISDVFYVPLTSLYDQNKKNSKLDVPLIWNEKKAIELFNYANIKEYKFDIEPQEFWTYRDCMQYIGTFVLKRHNNMFHINKTIQNIDCNKDYVCDDVRFLDELNALKDIGAKCIYVLRPNNFEISNHSSEISVNWADFDYHLINNVSLDRLKKDFKNSIRYFDYTPKSRKSQVVLTRDFLLQQLSRFNFDTAAVAGYLNCSRDKIVWWAKRFIIHIPSNQYYYDNSAFMYADKYSAYYAGLLSADGCIKRSGKSYGSYLVELASDDFELVSGFKSYLKTDKPIFNKVRKNRKIGYTLSCHSPFIVENLKYWNMKPRKSKYNEIPDIISDNPKLMKYWLLGLIDGDGSVFFSKGKPNISILGSKQVIDFIRSMFPNLTGSYSNHKKIDNLYNWRLHNNDAIFLYHTIYDPIALNRKWQKMSDFQDDNS